MRRFRNRQFRAAREELRIDPLAPEYAAIDLRTLLSSSCSQGTSARKGCQLHDACKGEIDFQRFAIREFLCNGCESLLEGIDRSLNDDVLFVEVVPAVGVAGNAWIMSENQCWGKYGRSGHWLYGIRRMLEHFPDPFTATLRNAGDLGRTGSLGEFARAPRLAAALRDALKRSVFDETKQHPRKQTFRKPSR